MKRMKYIFISSFCAFFMFTSCEDAYNIVQDGELNESAITTVPLLQDYLNGTYATVSTANEVGFTSIFTDETSIGIANGGQNLGLHSFFLTPGEGYASGVWYAHYATINRVNRIMRMVTDPDGAGPLLPQVVEPIPNTPENAALLVQYKEILAQARGLRAFSYFQLLSYFSTDLKNDNALGVMLFTHVPLASERLPRSTNGLVFAQIESDLNFAYDNVSTAATYKYVSRNMINALRARMYLYRGNFVLAKQYAQEVITNGPALAAAIQVASPAPTNPLTTVVAQGGPTPAWNTAFYSTSSTAPNSPPYRKMFSDLAPGELIFALDRPTAGPWGNIATLFTTNSTTAAGSPLFEVSRALFNKLGATPGDVRRYTSVDPSSRLNPNYLTDPNYVQSDVLVIDKYPGKPNAITRNDEKVFRVSEMYFILAECLANEGNINGASNSVASIIKLIRDTRNFLPAYRNQTLPVYATATDAYKAIMDERRLEFCFEGHRYLDIKRLGPLAGQTVDRDPTDDRPGSSLSIPNNDYRFTMPIPTDERNANPGIQQNPQY